MTLMIASIRTKSMVITADGRSTQTRDGKVAFNDHFQKLFPVPDHPVVFGEFGDNRLGGVTLKDFFDEFVAGINTGDLTIQQIADELRNYAHARVRKRLKSEGENPPYSVNLWIAGFSMQQKKPSMVELFWKWKQDVLYTEERQFNPIFIVPGGSGVAQIDKVDWHKADDSKSIDEVRAYHQQLMKQAITAKVEPNMVGGDVHELVITAEKWEWTIPPRDALPATRPTTQR